ncbi:hypothetical protein F511_32665 [Dorcoceras hygrometricum]|uniref:Uncharacterized protein n=1 Tax=Dorcoceras hygrometricum TaxID=472368 RepID=A0A2Z7CK50_9LAMI|nr:hypothetical protein F511_32665 [Dorcoceras hygrometricum]
MVNSAHRVILEFSPRCTSQQLTTRLTNPNSSVTTRDLSTQSHNTSIESQFSSEPKLFFTNCQSRSALVRCPALAYIPAYKPKSAYAYLNKLRSPRSADQFPKSDPSAKGFQSISKLIPTYTRTRQLMISRIVSYFRTLLTLFSLRQPAQVASTAAYGHSGIRSAQISTLYSILGKVTQLAHILQISYFACYSTQHA